MSDRKKPRSLSEIVNDVLRAVRDYYDSEYQKLLLDIITKYLYKVIVIDICYLLLLYEDYLHL